MGAVPKNADPVVVAKARLERERARARDRHAERQARIEQTRAQGPRKPSGGRPVVPVEDQARVRAARAAYEAALAHAAKNQTTEAGTAEAGTADTDGTAGSGTTGEAGEAVKPDRPAKQDGVDLKANPTDPESRLLKTRNGWIQGYNCQTAVSDDGFFVSARATQDTNDVKQFVPTMHDVTATAAHLADRTGRDDLTVGTMIGDAGYDSNANLDADGPDRLIADAKSHRINQRAATEPATSETPGDASPREKMNHRLRTPEGHALYKRRSPMAEAPNAWLKDRRGLRRFARRGLTAVQAELSFACAVTNLLKLATNGITATHLQAR
jgi:hypothetical protein